MQQSNNQSILFPFQQFLMSQAAQGQFPGTTDFQQFSPFSLYDQQSNNYSMMKLQSVYSSTYQDIQEILYYEPGDGEIFVYYDQASNQQKMVTCIDISTLFKEKKAKAINITNFLGQVRHPNVVQIYSHHIVDEKYVYIEMEVPQNLALWKTFCKKKLMPDEVLNIISQVGKGLEFLHSLSFVHRDVHPSRFQQFPGNVIKFNPIGLPYNFKKLLKRDNFSGHINYSAPELILEKAMFSQKVDVWSLGCCLYYLVIKKDPFDGSDPNEIKRNILNLTLDISQYMMIPLILKPILEACLIVDENIRPTSAQLMTLISQIQLTLKSQGFYPQAGMQLYSPMYHNLSQSNPYQQQQLPQPLYKMHQQFQPQPYVALDQQTLFSGSSPSSSLPKLALSYTEFRPSSKQQQLQPSSDQQSTNTNSKQPTIKLQQTIKSLSLNDLEDDGTGGQQQLIKESLNSSLFDTHQSDAIEISFDSDSKDKRTHHESYQSEDQATDKSHSSINSAKISHSVFEDTFSRNSPQKSYYQKSSHYQLNIEQKVIYNDEEGNIYEGEMQNSKKHGFGKQIFSNGNFYEGQWKNGNMEGEGKLVLTTGEIYIGQFVKGKRQGKGKLIFTASGDVYEGDWQMDKMTGKGKYTYADEKVFEGDYVEGAPYGYGIMSCEQFYYEGYFKSGLFEGHGKLKDFVNNQEFEGEYYDGKRKGFGKLLDRRTGEIFEGDWKEDMKEGTGKLYNQRTGQVIEGKWHKDELVETRNNSNNVNKTQSNQEIRKFDVVNDDQTQLEQ